MSPIFIRAFESHLNISLFFSIVFLMLASQRIETVMDFSGEQATLDDELPTKRGAAPTLIEWTILSWVSGEYCQIILID